MLKNFSHIILSALLLISTVGVAISKHYCSGSFVSISVFQEAESCCGGSDCCHNEDQFYQVKDNFSAPAVLTAPDLAGFDLLVVELNPDFQDLFVEVESEIQFNDYSPPPPDIQTALSKKQSYLL